MEQGKNDTDVAVEDPEKTLEQLTKLAAQEEADAFLPGAPRPDRLFIYDELLNYAVIQRYLDHPRQEMICRVPAHKLAFPKFLPPRQTGLASIVRSRDREDSVWGVCVDLKGQDLKLLERYKGTPDRYHRRGLVVTDRGDRKFDASTYVISTPDEAPSKPSKELLATIIAGANQRSLPEEYIKFLESIETLD